MSHDQLTAVDQSEAAVIQTDSDRILCKKSTSDGSEMSAAFPNLMVFSPVGNATDGNDSEAREEAPAEHTNGHSNGAHEDDARSNGCHSNGSNGCHGNGSHDHVSHGNGANVDAEVSFKPVPGSDIPSGDEKEPRRDNVDPKPEDEHAAEDKDGPAENNDGSSKADTKPDLEQTPNAEADVEAKPEEPKKAEEESMAGATSEQLEAKPVDDAKHEAGCTAI